MVTNVRRKKSSAENLGDTLALEAIRYGPVVTFAVMTIMSVGVGYLIYSYVLSGWVVSNAESRQSVITKEVENKNTEGVLAGEAQFRAQFKKVADLYEDAKPLLPQESEVGDVLAQVEATAERNNVTLTGLSAVNQSIKSPKAEKLYEREIPAVVTGSYPRVVRFFSDISRMPRILIVRDYSITSIRNTVSASFTLVAYHAPPPAEIPALPKDLAMNDK